MLRAAIHHCLVTQLLTLVEECCPLLGCPDWASAGAWAFAAMEVVPLDLPGLEQQVGAAGWWVEPSVAATHSGTAAC